MIPDDAIFSHGSIAPTKLDPLSGFLHSEVDGVLMYAELLALTPASEAEVTQRLMDMVAKGFLTAPQQVLVAVDRGSADDDDLVAPTGVTGQRRVPSPAKTSVEDAEQKTVAPTEKRKIVRSAKPLDRNDTFRKKVALQKRASQGDDHYRVLGISKGIRGEKLQNAFHKLSLIFHPDRIPVDLRDDGDLRHDVDELYNRLREAYDVLADDGRRKAWARERLLGKVHTDNTEAVTANQDAVKTETLLNMMQVELDKLDLRSARSSWQIARQLDPLNPRVQEWGTRLNTVEKIAVLAEKVQNAGYLDDREKKKVAVALTRYEDNIVASRALCSRVFLGLIEFEIDLGLAVRLLATLASGKMIEEEYAAAGDLYSLLRRPEDALRYLLEGVQRFPGSTRLKSMHKEAKRRAK